MMHSHPVQTDPAKTSEGRIPPSTWILLGVLIVLIVIAILLLFARTRTETPEEQLRGDSEEASIALSNVLSRTPSDQQVSLLMKYVQDKSPGLRYAAVDALGNQRGAGVADAVERAFTDSSSVVRQRALEVLPNVDLERGLRLLLAGLRDEDMWIREAAASQLKTGTIGSRTFVDRRAVPMLVRALDDPDPVVPELAIGVLRKLTGQPWHASHGATAEQRQAVIGLWQRWWGRAGTGWAVPPAYREVAAISPTRTDPAHAFNLTDIDGLPLRLAGQRGRVTLLNFWGTWCGPCQQEIPDLVKLDQAYRARKLDVVGIALGEQEGADGLRRWCRAHGVAYRQALATDEVLAAYGDIHEVPISVLIDAQGRVCRRWEGERDFATFRAAVERLLPAP